MIIKINVETLLELKHGTFIFADTIFLRKNVQ